MREISKGLPSPGLTTHAAAKILGVSIRHVQRLIADGTLEAFDISRSGRQPRYRIPRANVLAFIETGQIHGSRD